MLFAAHELGLQALLWVRDWPETVSLISPYKIIIIVPFHTGNVNTLMRRDVNTETITCMAVYMCRDDALVQSFQDMNTVINVNYFYVLQQSPPCNHINFSATRFHTPEQ